MIQLFCSVECDYKPCASTKNSPECIIKTVHVIKMFLKPLSNSIYICLLLSLLILNRDCIYIICNSPSRSAPCFKAHFNVILLLSLKTLYEFMMALIGRFWQEHRLTAAKVLQLAAPINIAKHIKLHYPIIPPIETYRSNSKSAELPFSPDPLKSDSAWQAAQIASSPFQEEALQIRTRFDEPSVLGTKPGEKRRRRTPRRGGIRAKKSAGRCTRQKRMLASDVENPLNWRKEKHVAYGAVECLLSRRNRSCSAAERFNFSLSCWKASRK